MNIQRHLMCCVNRISRYILRLGLDRPSRKRPFMTPTQIYFFIGITFTLTHFYTVIHPVLISNSSTTTTTQIDLNSSDSIEQQQTDWVSIMQPLLWISAIMAMIGIGGFMYLDPGLVKKNEKHAPAGSENALEISQGHSSATYSAEWLVSQCLSGTPVCAICRIVKPIRSKHCELCGGCVLRMDHHCPWVNSCVGMKNHRSFFFIILCMITAASCHAYFMFQFVIGSLDTRSNSQDTSIFDEKLALFLMLHSGLIVVCCFALTIGQSYTICKGLTTNEAFNRFRYGYLKNNKGNSPFSEGGLKNCLAFIGVRNGKSFVRSTHVPAAPNTFLMDQQYAQEVSMLEDESVALEMQSLLGNQLNQHQHGSHGSHGHSHGAGGNCSHSHGNTNNGVHNHVNAAAIAASAAHSHSHSHPMPSLHGSSILTPSVESLIDLDQEAECAYFPTSTTSNSNMTDHIVGAAPSSSSAAASSSSLVNRVDEEYVHHHPNDDSHLLMQQLQHRHNEDLVALLHHSADKNKHH